MNSTQTEESSTPHGQMNLETRSLNRSKLVCCGPCCLTAIFIPAGTTDWFLAWDAEHVVLG